MTDLPQSTPALPPPTSSRELILLAEAASLPAESADYVRFLRGPRWRGGKSVLGIVLGLASFLVVTNVISTPFYLVPLLDGGAVESLPADMPIVALVSIAASLPLMLLVQRWTFGVRGRWLHSVEGRFRWGLALRAALVMAVTFAIAMGIPALVEGVPIAPDLSALSIITVVIAVMVIPFQAAAEEYLVRGLIARSSGSWARTPWVGLLVSALTSSVLFALLHGNLLPGLMLYFSLFGAVLWWLTWRTGGLEAAVGVHAAFNALSFLQAFLFDESVGLSTTVGAAEQFEAFWVMAPLAVTTLLILWWFRRDGVRRTYAAD